MIVLEMESVFLKLVVFQKNRVIQEDHNVLISLIFQDSKKSFK